MGVGVVGSGGRSEGIRVCVLVKGDFRFLRGFKYVRGFYFDATTAFVRGEKGFDEASLIEIERHN